MSKPTVVLAFSLSLLVPGVARAHCDTLDGPVVETARKALHLGQVNAVLAWVRPADEAEIRAAFNRALAVRKAGSEARQLADTWFFETLVRVHRAGEGAPFTGLEPAGQDLGPAVPVADEALEKGSLVAVEKLLSDAVRSGLRERYARVMAQRPPAFDITAGRAWVAAYVPFVHYVEGVFEAAHGKQGTHAEPTAEPHADQAAVHQHGAH